MKLLSTEFRLYDVDNLLKTSNTIMEACYFVLAERRRSPSPGGRSPSPARGILKQPSSGVSNNQPYYEEEQELPVRDTGGRAKSPAGRAAPGGRVPQGRGPTVSAGGRTSPSMFYLESIQHCQILCYIPCISFCCFQGNSFKSEVFL